MSEARYVVVYEQTGSGWSAYAPDLPGCVAAGDTREDVERLMREAIKLHLEALRASGEPIPEPRTWTEQVEAS